MPDFRGFHPQRYTQMPNEFVDDLLAELSGAETKVMVFIFRQTFGWQRDADNIALSQIRRATGVSRSAIQKALRVLIDKGLIEAHHNASVKYGTEATTYRVRMADDTPVPLTGPPRSLSSQVEGVTPYRSDGPPYLSQVTQKKPTSKDKEHAGENDRTTEDLAPLWATASAWLEPRMGGLWHAWLKDAQLVALTTEQATIAIPPGVGLDNARRTAGFIGKALAEAGRPVAVAFVVGR